MAWEDGGAFLPEEYHEYLRLYAERQGAALAMRPALQRLHRITLKTGRTVVAICVSTTTHNLLQSELTPLQKLPLFSTVLPSLLGTLPPVTDGYDFWLYVGFDGGDAFFEQPGRQAEVRNWLRSHLEKPLKQEGVLLQTALLRFPNNALHKPGPTFNFLAGAAFEDGADYVYRISDDTKLVGNAWVAQAVKTLQSFSPRDVGVVGPLSGQSRDDGPGILANDMVHRSHLSVFGFYYPPLLTGWSLSRWMSEVYGPERTQHGPFSVEVVPHAGPSQKPHGSEDAGPFDILLAAGQEHVRRLLKKKVTHVSTESDNENKAKMEQLQEKEKQEELDGQKKSPRDEPPAPSAWSPL